MFAINSIVTSLVLPKLHLHRSQTSKSSSSSEIFAKNYDHALSWDNTRRMRTYYKTTRKFLVRSVVGPGAPVPPEPPFNFINWILGMAFTVVLPLLGHKWTSLLKIKNEVDSAVQVAEDIVEAVEKVSEGVEKAAEDILDDLPEGGRLRKAVDFVEHIAERANRDAQALDDFIDKAQEAEEKLENRFESLAEEAIIHNHKHKHHQEEEEEHRAPEEEERAQEPPRKEDADDVDKHY